MGIYITQADLANALGPGTMIALFDDNNDGTPDPGPIEDVISRAEGMVDSYLGESYTLPLKASADRLVKHAAVQFALVLAFDRHPEFSRLVEERRMRLDEAKGLMQRLINAEERLPDEQANQRQKNVGGILIDDGPRLMSEPGGKPNTGDF